MMGEWVGVPAILTYSIYLCACVWILSSIYIRHSDNFNLPFIAVRVNMVRSTAYLYFTSILALLGFQYCRGFIGSRTTYSFRSAAFLRNDFLLFGKKNFYDVTIQAHLYEIIQFNYHNYFYV